MLSALFSVRVVHNYHWDLKNSIILIINYSISCTLKRFTETYGKNVIAFERVLTYVSLVTCQLSNVLLVNNYVCFLNES